ncbi:hypothetical protein JCM33374_g1305 [Metschnikowia sp. JCM 33374]|nr:hypothetical protein JCM33374_g1305 [Metschnikowia sp. JCM 33374]
MMTHNLPYQVLKVMPHMVHEVLIAVALISIPVITSIIHQLGNMMEHASVDESGQKFPELSRETPKCLANCRAVFYEYMCIISEVVVSSNHLKEVDARGYSKPTDKVNQAHSALYVCTSIELYSLICYSNGPSSAIVYVDLFYSRAIHVVVERRSFQPSSVARNTFQSWKPYRRT